MRQFWLFLPLALVLGCTSAPSPTPAAISCQPYGRTPAPIAFSYAPGPVTSAVAEQTAVALFRSCFVGATLTDLTSSSTSTTGMRDGPNQGQVVWLVQVDATVNEPSPGQPYQSHFLIEVNQTTGVPTVVAYG